MDSWQAKLEDTGAFIFDMDGLLIDSEPFWVESETQVFAGVGVELTPELCRRTRGLRIDDVVRYWYRRWPWQEPGLEVVAEDIVAGVIDRIRRLGGPLPGALETVEFARGSGRPVALATGSPPPVIQAVLKTLALEDYFDAVVSGADASHGKPHPAIFLAAAARMEQPADACLVLEDSVFGVVAAKAARMICVAVPAAEERHDPRFVLADRVIDSLAQFPSLYRP